MDAHDFLGDDFSSLRYDILPCPNAAYKLRIGEGVRVAVVFEFTHTVDYWGEGDVDLVYLKQRVLRRHPVHDFYISKRERNEQ